MTEFKEELTELLYNWDMSFTGNFINELEKIHLNLVDKAVDAEREGCAKLIENGKYRKKLCLWENRSLDIIIKDYAKAIRARSKE